MYMYVETIGHEEERIFYSGLSNERQKGTRFVMTQFNILITDRDGKQIKKYKIWEKTIRKSKKDPAYFFVDEAMNVAFGSKGLSVYCDREELVNVFDYVSSFSGRLPKWGASSQEEEAYSLWHSRQGLRKNFISLHFYYDVEKVRSTFNSIVW